MLKQAYYFLFIILLSFCTYTATGQRKAMWANSNGWYPADFNPANQILLIEEPMRKPRKRTLAIPKKYPGKYELFRSPADLANDAKYTDTNIYKFMLRQKKRQGRTDLKLGMSPIITDYYDYYFVRRSNGQGFPDTNNDSSASYLVLEEIIKYINKQQ